MRVVAAREPRKVELFGIKIHLKPMLFGCSPSWFYFTSWFRLYQLRCYTSIRTPNFWPPKVAPDCGVFQNLNCTKWHRSDTWAQAQLEQIGGAWQGPRWSDSGWESWTAPFATIFGCDRKFGILFWLLQKTPLDHGYITRPSADIYDSMIALGFYSRCRSQWPFNDWGCGVPAIFS